ncbi:2-hydroxyacid dehydrogenase [Roseobacteraceae bacterium S113]
MPDLLQIGGITEAMRVRLAEKFTIHPMADLPEGWLAENGAKITHVATNGHDGVPAPVMEACPNLKMVGCYGVGYDAIDTDACVARGIPVSHTPDVLNAEVATTAVMLMLALFREMRRDDAYVRSGQWAKQGNAPLTRSADGRRVGLLGMGRIGQEIARKLSVFDAEIHYHSRSPKDVDYTYHADLVEMAKAVEVLIVITPGGAATRHLVNAEVMAALGPEGMLINVARGTVVDEVALVQALSDGTLGSAGLDVFDAEPQVPEALFAMENVILLPHVGSATHETRAAMGALVVDNILSHLESGTLLTSVPETAGL